MMESCHGLGVGVTGPPVTLTSKPTVRGKLNVGCIHSYHAGFRKTVCQGTT
jgi:hypothetical protein